MNKKFWFCLTYIGKGLDAPYDCHASTYCGFDDKKLTLNRIEQGKTLARVASNSALIAASYLGHMTEEEFCKD